MDRDEKGRKRSGDRGRKRSRPGSSSASPEVDSRACHGTGIEVARQLAVRKCGACTWSIISMDTWQARIVSGWQKSATQSVSVRRLRSQGSQLTRATAARRPAEFAGRAALLGWVASGHVSRVRGRTFHAM